jgi:transcriptional regulator with XRE-family HTH domain
MSVSLDPSRLRRELARRGLSATDLAREARLSAATVSAALAGRPITTTSLQLIADVLMRVPVVDVIDGLLLRNEDEPVLD